VAASGGHGGWRPDGYAGRVVAEVGTDAPHRDRHAARRPTDPTGDDVVRDVIRDVVRDVFREEEHR